MIEPSWWLVAFAWFAGGGIGFWCCAAMVAGARADQQDEQHEQLWRREP